MLVLAAVGAALVLAAVPAEATVYLRGNVSVAVWADGPTADWIDFALCPESSASPCSGGVACAGHKCLAAWQGQVNHIPLGQAAGLLLATVANGFNRPLTVVGVSITEASDAAVPGRPAPATPPDTVVEHGRLQVRRGGVDAAIGYRARLDPESGELVASFG